MDLTFKTEQGRFNYRVGAIIIHNNKLLMVTNENVSYFYSVGGRVNMDETAEEAVKREVFEETGLSMENDHMAVIQEKFFTEATTKEHFHEIAFYFLMKDQKEVETICESFTEYGETEHLKWIPLNKLSDYVIYPEFFQKELPLKTDGIRHIVTRQN